MRWRHGAVVTARFTNPFEPLRAFSDDQVEHIHRSALAVLEGAGIKVLLPEARRLFAAAGATVSKDGQVVRIDGGVVTKALATAPRLIDLHALDSNYHVTVGGRHSAVVPVSGPPT